MIYFTAHTFKCLCHCRRAMFRVLGMYNFDFWFKNDEVKLSRFFFEIYRAPSWFAAAQCKPICPERLNWPSRSAGISEGAH